MQVPSDSFGGKSPERYAADMLKTFFTFVSCKIVLYQMEGMLCHGERGSYNDVQYNLLQKRLLEKPLRGNADDWLSDLMKENEMLAVRIMEVREAYCQDEELGFEWANMQHLCQKGVTSENLKLLQNHAVGKYGALMHTLEEEK